MSSRILLADFEGSSVPGFCPPEVGHAYGGTRNSVSQEIVNGVM